MNEPVYLILATSPDQHSANEAAESGHRAARQASGGRKLSPAASPLVRIPVGVVIERRKAASAWTDFIWRAVGVLPGAPDIAALDDAARRSGSHALLCRQCRDRSLPLGDRALSRKSGLRCGQHLGGIESIRRAVALCNHGGYRRLRPRARVSLKRRPIWSNRCRCRMSSAAPLKISSPSTTSRGKSSSSASAAAPIPRRSRGARAEVGTNDGQEFLSRWSRRKRDGEGGSARSEAAAPRRTRRRRTRAPASCRKAWPKPPRNSISRHCRRSNSICSGHRRHRIPAQGRSAGVESRGASSRLDRRPAIRDFVGLAENAWDFNDPERDAGIRPAGLYARTAARSGRQDRRRRAARDRRNRGPSAPHSGTDQVRRRRLTARFAGAVDVPPQRSDKSLAKRNLRRGTDAPEVPAAVPQTFVNAGEQPAKMDGPSVRRTHGGALPR